MEFKKLKVGDVIKIDESIVKLSCQLGSRDWPFTSEHYLLRSVGRKYYYFAGFGKHPDHSLWRKIANRIDIKNFHSVLNMEKGILSVLSDAGRDEELIKAMNSHLLHFNKMDVKKIYPDVHQRAKEELQNFTDFMCKIDINSSELSKALLVL